MRYATVTSLILVPLGAALVLTACVPSAKEHFVKYGLEKASFDLRCDKERIDFTELSSWSMGVYGCGKRARYEFVQGTGWVLNAVEK